MVTVSTCRPELGGDAGRLLRVMELLADGDGQLTCSAELAFRLAGIPIERIHEAIRELVRAGVLRKKGENWQIVG